MSRIEWGVLWEETGEVEPVESHEAAEELIRLHIWAAHAVTRTITYSEWSNA